MSSRNFDLSQTPSDSILVFPDVPVIPSPGQFLGAATATAGRAQLSFFNPATFYIPASGGTMTGPLILSRDPQSNPEAATKQYADTKVALAGGQMTGLLGLSGDPTLPLHAVTKQYSDTKVPLAGGTMTGPLVLNADPVNPLGAATRQYVDNRLTTTTGAYLPLAGGTLTGALTVQGGAVFAASDPRVPDLIYDWQDANGNIVGGIGADGSWRWGAGTFTTLTASTVSASSVALAADPTTALQAATKQYVDGFLTSSGSTLSPARLNLQENYIMALDPRVPDFPWVIQDVQGNIGAYVDKFGTFHWGSAQINALNAAGATVSALSIGADSFGAIDPRIPDFVYAWQDANGNIVAGITSSGTFSATFGNTNLLPLSGGTLTGPLILAADPTNSLGAATKNYVDTKALLLTGGTMLGPIALAADPTSAPQAATKGYVDQAVLNAGGSGPGLDPTFNTVNVPDHYLIGGKTAIRMWTANPGSTGVDGLPNTHVGQYITSVGNGNTLIGCYAGGPGMTSGENTYVGMQAGASHTGSGQQNVAMGCGALRVDVSPQNVVAVGSDVCRNSTNNLRSVFVGAHAGRNGNAIADCVFIGNWVGFGTDGQMPAFAGTVAIGSYVMADPAMTAASNSVLLGNNVARKAASASGNLIVGPNVASTTLISGTGDIYIGASAAIDAATATENHTFRLGNHATNLMRATNINTASPQFFLDWLPASTSYANDAAAQAGGVAVGQLYRNGSAVQCRVT